MALPQPLHIFQKDVRHLWPETLVVLVLFVAFAWTAPYGWQNTEYSPYLQILSVLLHVLMPVSWLVVISRLIHDELLVGDRQFWTSRPYHWGLLLIAKLLYLVTFLYLPFLIMQVYLLKHAGLYPTTAIPALLHNLLLLSVFLIVPITALAAVTSTFARLLLTFVGAIVYCLVVIGIYGYLVFLRMPPPHLSTTIFTLVIVLPAVALFYQYATRRTAVSRSILLATPLLIVLLLALTPATALIHSTYPVASGSDLPQFSPIPVPPNTPIEPGEPLVLRGQVPLQIPLRVAGEDKDSNYAIDGVAPSISGDGVTWSSGYIASFGQTINAGASYIVVRTAIPKAIFDKVHASPVDVHLSIAADHMKAGPATMWKSSAAPFAIPHHGVCVSPTNDEGTPQTPVCRFALVSPEYLVASAAVTAGPCSSPAGQPVQSVMLLKRPDIFNFDPVVQIPLDLRTGDSNPRHAYTLCAGTPVSFVDATLVGKVRLEVDDKGLVLDPLAERRTVRNVAVPGPGPEQQ